MLCGAAVEHSISDIMISYMMPIEEKPPPAPAKGRMALELALARSASRDTTSAPRARSAISKDSSTSSFASDLTCSSMTPTSAIDKPKQKLLTNGTKHTSLKRVSFGSSKGSMVETLIYESPLQEEPENSPPAHNQPPSFPPAPIEDDSERSKVRVSFYQGVRPQCLSPPSQESSQQLFAAFFAASNTEMATETLYNRQISTESGWDNPFRPDGDLSREADEIVSLIKGGKPITPTPPAGGPQLVEEKEEKHHANNLNTSVTDSPRKPASPHKAANGTQETKPGPVEVQRSPPQEPQQAEHVLIKKKPKCKCCVLQ